MFFDELELVFEDKLFLMRINEKGLGMSLYLLTAEKEIAEIMKLKSLSWIISKIDTYQIQLKAFSDKGKHLIKIHI